MLLDPVAPTMVDARNSMLAADMMRYGGANQKEIWRAFAQRGLGAAAAAHPRHGATTTRNPVPDFASPLGGNTEVTFELAGEAPGDPDVVGNVYVGHYEKQVDPIADTDPATTNSGIDVNRDATASFVHGEYDFLVVAKGHGCVPVQRRPEGGRRDDQACGCRRTGPRRAGATATGDGTGSGNAIDETEATNWSADGRAADGTLSGIPASRSPSTSRARRRARSRTSRSAR